MIRSNVLLGFVLIIISVRTENPTLYGLPEHLIPLLQLLNSEQTSRPIAHILWQVLQTQFQRNDLNCSSFSRNLRHCICSTYQQIDDIDELSVEMDTSNISILTVSSTSNNSYYHLNTSYNGLHSFPGNICDFPKIVLMDLSFNKIKDIDLVSCITFLDTFILHHNLVEYLSNTTFLHLKFIRVIDLSHNRLKYIEPGFLINMNGSLFKFDVSYNYLTTLDITNILWTQLIFCKANFSHNSINSFTNILNWKSQDNSVFSIHGVLDASFNNLKHFSMFNENGLNLKHAGKLNYWAIFARKNPWICDCKVYPFAKSLEIFVALFHQLNFFMNCDSPRQLKNKTFFEVIAASELDQLVCNLSLAEWCPLQCHCFYQPAVENRTVVDCSGSRLTRFYSVLPLYGNLEIDFSNNSLRNLNMIERSKLDYFKRITKIDLSNNNIAILSNIALNRFRKLKLVNMRDNDIKKIPRSLQMLKPCQISLGNIIMKCTCDDVWLKIWLPLQYQNCANSTQVLCNNDGLLRSITEIEKEDLGCSASVINVSLVNSSICAAFFAVITCAMIIYKLRFELFILTRTVITFFRNPLSPTSVIHDIYISSNEDDELIRKWLLASLVPCLEKKGFDVFLFFRDGTIGEPREQETIDVISKSRNFIILLSDDTKGNQQWNKREWKYAWNYYKWDFSRELIIINYDLLTYDDVVKHFFRGFFTLRKVIDFSNFNNSIEEDIVALLK
ncbi:toll-like receptor 13 [Mytilus californianus]|uniref:toll-like receptor 13 n=1 Tax=Mytilus californianus TaxID=6549 RepID=UPI0022473BDC|nr:toll-like receptor 13 [Mytilus californianus]